MVRCTVGTLGIELPLSWHRSPDDSLILSPHAVDKKNLCFLHRISDTMQIPAVIELSQLRICFCLRARRFSVWNRTLVMKGRHGSVKFSGLHHVGEDEGGGNVSGTRGKEQWDCQKKSTSNTCVYVPDTAYVGNDDKAVRVLNVYYIVSEV
jgi:hypothetical protein